MLHFAHYTVLINSWKSGLICPIDYWMPCLIEHCLYQLEWGRYNSSQPTDEETKPRKLK